MARHISSFVPNQITVGILWGPGCFATGAAAVVDALRAMNTLASVRHGGVQPLQWHWLPLPGETAAAPPPAPASGGAAAPPDVLVIPGWLVTTGPQLRQFSRTYLDHFAPLLHAHVTRGGRIAAFFNGSALLAEAGLLSGREASLPWALAPSIVLQSGHAVRWRRDRSWHADGPIWTTSALPESLAAFLDLLGHTSVAELAKAVGTVLRHDPQRQLTATEELETPNNEPMAAGALERARRWLQVHRNEPYSLAATAHAAATSPRTLLRWFSQVHGQTPLQYLHGLRVAQAQVLLQTTYLTVEAVARQCGYGDVGSFRKVFTRATSETPTAYRQRFLLRTSRKQWTGPQAE
ncbi:GlxA family transcriptional regulator [Ottowia sp. VDI28]|uniref:GlxA family transcriptional regulator n=1 Tax=Ottowia sp. VDI28 TaxID=3133968 RepID=UPI003C305734